ncbi:MAG: hypothetical protein R2828_14375 [Saprospiraceae bacterium]
MSYQILFTTEANQLISKDRKNEFPRVEEITSCAVYKLTNGSTILIPFDSSTSALFHTFEECLSFIEGDKIQEVRTGNQFELVKEKVLNIEETWTEFITVLADKLNRKIEVCSNKAYLMELNKDIMKYGKRKAEKDLYIEIGVYLCCVLKKIVRGIWGFQEYNVNTPYNFFIPVIKDEAGIEYQCWKKIAESFYENRRFDLVEFLKWSSIYVNVSVEKEEIERMEPQK